MTLKRILRAFVSVKEKVLLPTGTNFTGSNEISFEKHGIYPGTGVAASTNFLAKSRRSTNFKWLMQGFLIVAAMLAAKAGYAQAPTTQASNVTFAATNATFTTINWANGN